MHLRHVVMFGILFLPLGPAASSAVAQATLEAPTRSATERFAFIGEAVQQHIDEGKLVGAVTWVSQGGQVMHLEAHGLRDREAGQALQTDSIFRIYSFTKSIATAAALKLWEQGKFQFDDPVAKYLPKFADQRVYDPAGNRRPKRPMTVADVMRHTSGIIYPNEWGTDLEKTWEAANLAGIDQPLLDFCDEVAALPLEFSPGDRWRYGFSIDVLAGLVEVWSGMSFDDYLRQEFFAPLGMRDTDFYVPADKLGRLVTMYERSKEGELERRDGRLQEDKFYVPTAPPEFCAGGSGLYSTARDYGRFLQTILDGGRYGDLQLLKPETVALMKSDQLPEHIAGIQFGDEVRDGFKFGFGFNVITKTGKWDPQARVGEFGWGGAPSCHYWLWPPQKLIVITLEATWPYNRNLENALKAKIYEALD